jgi:hypothetical protein
MTLFLNEIYVLYYIMFMWYKYFIFKSMIFWKKIPNILVYSTWLTKKTFIQISNFKIPNSKFPHISKSTFQVSQNVSSPRSTFSIVSCSKPNVAIFKFPKISCRYKLSNMQIQMSKYTMHKCHRQNATSKRLDTYIICTNQKMILSTNLQRCIQKQCFQNELHKQQVLSYVCKGLSNLCACMYKVECTIYMSSKYPIYKEQLLGSLISTKVS